MGTVTPTASRHGGALLIWVIAYAVIGVITAAGTSMFADRFRTGGGMAILLTAFLWPVVLVGAAQLMLWTAAVGRFGSDRRNGYRYPVPPETVGHR